jgi:hypothetical protein
VKLYPVTKEEIYKDLPLEKEPRFRMTVYADDDYAHDLVIKRSMRGILF